MTTDLLTLTQWLSPAFPLGSFAYSHGLETAIRSDQVRDAETLFEWLLVILEHGSGWNDAVLLCAARKGDDVADLARALAASRERLEETEAQGAAFATTLAAMGQSIEAAPFPVALGTASRDFDLENYLVIELYLQSFMSNLVQIAVRFVPLGQSTGQEVLGRLAPFIQETAARAARATPSDLGGGAFCSDISAMCHESEVARMFQS